MAASTKLKLLPSWKDWKTDKTKKIKLKNYRKQHYNFWLNGLFNKDKMWWSLRRTHEKYLRWWRACFCWLIPVPAISKPFLHFWQEMWTHPTLLLIPKQLVRVRALFSPQLAIMAGDGCDEDEYNHHNMQKQLLSVNLKCSWLWNSLQYTTFSIQIMSSHHGVKV